MSCYGKCHHAKHKGVRTRGVTCGQCLFHSHVPIEVSSTFLQHVTKQRYHVSPHSQYFSNTDTWPSVVRCDLRQTLSVQEIQEILRLHCLQENDRCMGYFLMSSIASAESASRLVHEGVIPPLPKTTIPGVAHEATWRLVQATTINPEHECGATHTGGWDIEPKLLL